MTDKRWTAIFGVLVMLVAAVGPMVGAAAPASSDATTEIDGDTAFAIDSELDEDDDENETTDNETAVNGTSSAAAADAFVAKLQQVVANATNDSNVSAPGRVIASYVVANNPGNAPDHAGPPNGTPGANATNATNASDGGPPEGTPGANATNGSSGGPPNGTPGGAPDGNETDGSDGAPGNGGGNGNSNGGGNGNGNGNGGGNGNGNGPNQLASATDAAADFGVDAALAVSATPVDA